MKSTSSFTPTTHFISEEFLIKYVTLVEAVLTSLVSSAIILIKYIYITNFNNS